MKAYAVVTSAPGVVDYVPVEVPEPTADDVVVRTVYSMISPGTEGSFIRGERSAGDTPWRPGDPLPFPHVPGYQKVGIAEWVGENVQDIQVGDLVFCTISKVNGMHFPTGGHISHAVTPWWEVWKLPAEADGKAVSGLVLTQVGFNCGMRPAISPGDAAVVVGDGLVGHWSAQTLALRGARVMLVGRHDTKLQRFKARPEDARLNVANRTLEELLQAVRSWAPQGVQAVIDTVGSVPSIKALYPAMRVGGHVVSAGFHGTKGSIDIQPMRNWELTLHAPAGWTRERMDATLEHVLGGKLEVTSLITHTFPIHEAQAAYEIILNKSEPYLGMLLEWNQD